MNRARAETFLRLLAEAELRHATARPPDSAPPLDGPGAAAMLRALPVRQREAITLQYQAGMSEAETAAAMRISLGAVQAHTARGMEILRASPQIEYARTRRIAQVLTAVGALDDEIAGQILDDFKSALAVRWLGIGHQRIDQLLRFGLGRRRVAAGPPAPTGPRAAPGRIVPLGQVIVFHGADVTGELHLLSYTRLALGPQLSVFALTRHQSGWWEPSEPRLFETFTATDDRGTSYEVKLRDIGGEAMGWTLILRPDPPHEPRWLDLSAAPGGPAMRIDLERRAPDAAEMTVRKTALSLGEYLLHTIAARLLAAASPVSPDMSPVTELASGGLALLADGLGDIVAALQACGALSLLSPIPGQVAALCASLNVDGHGITAPLVRDLPEPWLSLLARYRRRNTGAAPARDGCAAAAVMLPELDGIRLAILGLTNYQDRTVLHMHASGPRSEVIYGPDELYAWATLWIRDGSGRWHATRTVARSGMNDEVALRVEVLPPLSRATDRIELVAAGPSAEIRATVPLHWE